MPPEENAQAAKRPRGGPVHAHLNLSLNPDLEKTTKTTGVNHYLIANPKTTGGEKEKKKFG